MVREPRAAPCPDRKRPRSRSFLLVGAVSWHQLSRKLAPADSLPTYGTYGTWALTDFRGNLYYPTRWFLAGGNPYDGTHADHYNVVRFPPYSPATFVAHWPFGLLPFGTSRLIWYATLVLATVPPRGARAAPRRPGAGTSPLPSSWRRSSA